jgi:hypothetical protein
MQAIRRVGFFVFWLFGVGCGGMAQPVPLVQQGPMRLNTDTPEYCHRLAHEVRAAEKARATTPNEIIVLSTEGLRMCDEGLIHGGVMRLRRAWQMLHDNDD